MNKTIDQISIFMENRPGQLSDVLEVLSAENINLRALCVAEEEEYGVLRLIVDDPVRAMKVLANEEKVAVINKVIAVEVPDRPGGLCELIKTFAADGVDIEYMYSVFGKTEGKAYMIFSAKNPECMLECIRRNNIMTADYDEMGMN